MLENYLINPMSSVTRRIREIKGTKDAQPRGGYLPLKTFAIEEYADNKLVSMSDENISASLVGTAVDYLARLSFTDNAEEIINPYPDTNIGVFEICLKGAILLGQKRTKQWAFNAVSEIVADYAVNKKK
ncbi:hypothetical protein IJJ18_00245 [Candidatus Saccharibacteria bacterium]|nr:hypothetical protein [Candidatus Saccharibacteria bacterium]